METNTLKYTVVKSFREKGITYKVIWILYGKRDTRTPRS